MSEKGGGSVKGRVLMPRAARVQHQDLITREGSCAWCGLDIRAGEGPVVWCPRCGSNEVDFPERPTPVKHTHVADTHCPGSIAFGVMGGTVFGRR